MKDSNRQPGRTSPMETFRRRCNELEELLALSQSAAHTLRSKTLSSFARLSELLDEVLPVEPDREAQLARTVALDLRELRRLRQGQLDPLQAPQGPLAELVDALRLDRSALRRLIAADHAAFAPVSARGNQVTETDAFAELEAALDRLALDSPDSSSG